MSAGAFAPKDCNCWLTTTSTSRRDSRIEPLPARIGGYKSRKATKRSNARQTSETLRFGMQQIPI